MIKGINESIHQASPLVGLDVGLPVLQEFWTINDMLMEESQNASDIILNSSISSNEITYAIQVAFHDMSSNKVTFCEQGLVKEVDPRTSFI